MTSHAHTLKGYDLAIHSPGSTRAYSPWRCSTGWHSHRFALVLTAGVPKQRMSHRTSGVPLSARKIPLQTNSQKKGPCRMLTPHPGQLARASRTLRWKVGVASVG